MAFDIEKIVKALERTGEVRVAVFGDYALDKYIYSDPVRDEPSAETGEAAYQFHRKKLSAGVGGTIANNLRALGTQVFCIGLLGEDGEGFELAMALEKTGADVSHMVRDPRICTSTYMKLLRKEETAGEEESDSVYHEVRRLDFRNYFEPPADLQEKMLDELKSLLAAHAIDAVIITDQYYQRNQGAVTDYLRQELSALAPQYPEIIFFADSRSFADGYHNMIVKCNHKELKALAGRPVDHIEEDAVDVPLDELEELGNLVSEKQNAELFITAGSRGMIAMGRPAAEGAAAEDDTAYPARVPAFRVTGPIDIVGAGDATNAGLVTGLVLGLTRAESARLACCISSITIQQLNTTGTATPAQVAERLRTWPNP